MSERAGSLRSRVLSHIDGMSKNELRVHLERALDELVRLEGLLDLKGSKLEKFALWLATSINEEDEKTIDDFMQTLPKRESTPIEDCPLAGQDHDLCLTCNPMEPY